MERGGAVYIMTNKTHSTLYIGVTSDLIKRLYEHQHNFYPNSFTSTYNLNKLVYFEGFHHIMEAIDREKQLKRWSRKKKNNLITLLNPNWDDLTREVNSW